MANPVWQGDDITVPNDWSDADNWDTGSVPVSTDSVYLRNNSVNVSAGLSQSAVTLTLLEIEASYTGEIRSGTTELAISATTLNIGRHLGTGTPAGSTGILINLGSNQSTVNIWKSATTSYDTYGEPIKLRGTHASNVLNLYGGIVGIGTRDPDDTATFATVNALGGTLNMTSGVTLTTVNVDGATVTAASNVTTWNHTSGTATLNGSATLTTLSHKAGTFHHQSTGTITTANVFAGATLNKWSGASTITTTNLYSTIDLSEATGTITFTNLAVLSEDAYIYDPRGLAVFSNAITSGTGIRKWRGYVGKGGSSYAITA